jgi:hypothetical protein
VASFIFWGVLEERVFIGSAVEFEALNSLSLGVELDSGAVQVFHTKGETSEVADVSVYVREGY